MRIRISKAQAIAESDRLAGNILMPVGEEMFRYHGYSGPCPPSAKQYMLLEVIGDGPNLHGCASWLCPYGDYVAFLYDAIDSMDKNMIATIRFTFLEFTDQELADYCQRHEIEWTSPTHTKGRET